MSSGLATVPTGCSEKEARNITVCANLLSSIPINMVPIIAVMPQVCTCWPVKNFLPLYNIKVHYHTPKCSLLDCFCVTWFCFNISILCLPPVLFHPYTFSLPLFVLSNSSSLIITLIVLGNCINCEAYPVNFLLLLLPLGSKSSPQQPIIRSLLLMFLQAAHSQIST